MICPKCGCEITGNYCSNCGMPLKTEGYEDQEHIENIEDIAEIRLKREALASRPRRSRKRVDRGSVSKSGKKEMHKKDARLKKMEGELSRLRTRAEESRKSLERMETLRREHDDTRQEQAGYPGEDPYQTMRAAGAGIVVLLSRLMQLASAFLMAAMTVVMMRSFWDHGQTLGDIRYVAEEHNYGLAVYAGFAGIAIFMGFIWCLWILSKKGAGGGVRMKKYDVGRGFLPFLFCMVVVVAAGTLLLKIPGDAQIWSGHLKGAYAAIKAVYAHRNGLFFCSVSGAVLSFIRKLLRV